MSLNIKAGVLTLISPLMKMNHFSFLSSIFPFISCEQLHLLYILFVFHNCFLTESYRGLNFCLCFTSAPPAPVLNLQVLKRHLKSVRAPSLTINSNGKS